MLNMKISRRGLTFIETWETFVGYVYDDKVPPRRINGKMVYPEYKGGPIKGTLTIGIGHTKAAKAVVDMSVGAKMTHEQALRVLDIDLDPCEACVNRLVKVELTQGQFDALVSFVFNCGEGNFAKSSILRRLNAGNYDGARAAFDLYTKSRGEYMRGLQRRRDAEQVLWDECPTKELVKHMPDKDEIVDHPADVDVPAAKTMAQSTEGNAALVQTAGGAVGNIKEGFDASAAADKAIEVKNQAENLGLQPIELFGKFGHMMDYLIHSPIFWVSTGVMALGIFIFFRRRWRLKQEG